MEEFTQLINSYLPIIKGLVPTMDQFIKILDIIIWPTLVFILSFTLKKPLKALLPLVDNVKYKGVEVKFKQELEQLREEATEAGIELPENIENKTEFYKLLEISPSAAIIESWKEIEHTARSKVAELSHQQPSYKNPERRPIEFLEHTGALSHQTAKTIRELKLLRNKAVHYKSSEILKDDALDYSSLSRAAISQINLIKDLPKVKHTALTLIILEINHLIDTGKYDNISISDIHREIENKNVIQFLKENTAGDSDFSIYGTDGPYSNFIEYYNEQLYQIYGGYAGNERRKWGIENKGLCLLLAWTNEIIQQGSGWYPGD